MTVSLFRTADALLVQYAAYHRDRRNILTHGIGIPMIFTAIAMWLVFPLGRLRHHGRLAGVGVEQFLVPHTG